MVNDKVDVLDHGFIRLVDCMGGDLSVVRAARVSHNAAWRDSSNESDARLIRYLYEHKHMTPFEAVTFTFEVKAPIFVFRQWHRHRTQSYNELSARYRELPEEVYLPNFRTQSLINKQGGSDEVSEEMNVTLRELYRQRYVGAFILYKAALAEGVSKELARCVLPVATYSHMFTTMNLRNLFAFLTLRNDEHAQYEIRVYASAMLHLIRSVVPESVAAWEKYV